MTGSRVAMFRGLPCVDATESITIAIGRQHVIRGAQCAPNLCAIHWAANARPDVIDSYIGAGSCYLLFAADPTHWVRYYLTQRGATMVRYFDEETDAVKATAAWMGDLTVTLKPCPPSRRLGAKGNQGTDKRSGQGEKRGDRRPSLRNVMVIDRG